MKEDKDSKEAKKLRVDESRMRLKLILWQPAAEGEPSGRPGLQGAIRGAEGAS